MVWLTKDWWGWQTLAYLRIELEVPQRNLPRMQSFTRGSSLEGQRGRELILAIIQF
jgi:hypothetical protein